MNNPLGMAQLAGFMTRHPKAVSFFQKQISKKLEDGTIIEIKIKRPSDENEDSANIKLTQADIKLIENLKNAK
ncbi:MAG: hypothetical protein Q4F88_01175 [Eubacteriales bacterium]|nr:hypothetical protein [Eubacteriales bacterium]